jgi:adenosylcobinamide kinase/adenosylcobinamide-phosphate guanylyltransferase
MPAELATKLILVLGGARSGKSSYAQDLALKVGGPDVLYLATAQAFDGEMQARIAAHQAERPAGWCTLEAPSLIGAPIAEAAAGKRVVLMDCMTLLASNALLSAGEDAPASVAEAAVAAEAAALLAACRAGEATWIVVSNEVGMGLVPPYPLGRVYRDALGRANQTLAAAADRVYLLVAGIPMTVK